MNRRVPRARIHIKTQISLVHRYFVHAGTGPITDLASLNTCLDALHALGAKSIVITSSHLPLGQVDTMLMIGSCPWSMVLDQSFSTPSWSGLWSGSEWGRGSHARFAIAIPRLSTPFTSFTGTGDLTGAYSHLSIAPLVRLVHGGGVCLSWRGIDVCRCCRPHARPRLAATPSLPDIAFADLKSTRLQPHYSLLTRHPQSSASTSWGHAKWW